MKIKGFDKDLKCRGYQFEIGKEYKIETDKTLKLCTDTVFHYCNSLQQVHDYYSCCEDSQNRFCEIEVLGKEVCDDNKCGSNHIRIVREIVGNELKVLKQQVNGNSGLFNTGNWNTGDCNTGNRNTGNRNTGNSNTGNRNTGDWNKSSENNGFFNTVEPTVFIFNKDSGMTAREFRNSKYYKALRYATLILTEWVNYTEDEKKKDPKKALADGYLKKYSYKKACREWWKNTPEEQQKIIMSIPNFDKEIFKEITGIDVEKENK